MGDYNPDAPVIGGNEFVGIRQELVSFSVAENTREVGTTFTLPTARQLGSGRFYIDHLPQSIVTNQPVMIGIYPKGQEGYTGPIQSVRIPVISGAVTGATLSGAATVQDALFGAANAGRVAFTSNGTVLQLNVHFNTTAYAQTLINKRILQVNVVYGMYGDVQLAVDSNSPLAMNMQDASSIVPYTQSLDGDSANAQSTLTRRVSLGEVNPYWNVPTNTLTTTEQLPWTMQQLLHFDNAAVNPYAVWFKRPASATGTGQLNITYCALEVIYCEEARVAYGCGRFGSSRGVAPLMIDTPLVFGMNAVTLRTPITDALNPVIAAGNYSVMINQPDGGDIDGLKTQGSDIEINGLRMLYALPAHQGVQTDIPWPPYASVGETFSTETVLTIPQTSIHLTGGGVLPEVQVYGRQIAGPVYGTVQAAQFFNKTNLQSSGNFYNQSRHYIRRFGNTQQPLVVTANGGGTTSITPAQFNVLPEIVDGWKEVTLRWTPFFIDTTASFPSLTFSDSGDTAGNRWEILGVDAPALSGTAGNLFNMVPAGQLLDSATYLQPTGDAVAMFWASPTASGAVTGDTSADMSFLISTTPAAPTVSGAAIQAQALPILFDCPTLVTDHFNRTTASGLGVPDSGGAAWTNTGGSGTDYSTTPAVGQHLMSANTVRVSTLPGITTDGSIAGYVYQPALAAGSIRQGISMRANAVGTISYSAIINTNAAGVQTLIILRRNTGETDLNSMVLPWTWAPDLRIALKLVVSGTSITAFAYREDQSQVQMLTTNDAAVSAGGGFGLYTQQLSGTVFNQNMQFTDIVANGVVGSTPKAIPTSISYIHLTWANLGITGSGFGYYEIQRQDDLDTSWKSIAKITTQATVAFDDYEARVGLQSQYRIRIANVMGFFGPFTNFTPVTIPSPGVTGNNVSNGVLIFTSNAGAGAKNVAYTPSWDGTPIEDVTFPESSRTQLQWMYDKNFMNAFSPTERGGEQFTRTILIQNAAAVGAVVEGAFRTLRDLGWSQLPYVCVRNDIGDRWFANVQVPSGSLQRNRQQGLIQAQVTEISLVPYQVQL